MRRTMMWLAAFSLAVPTTVTFTPTQAEARAKTYRSGKYRHYRKRCRYSSGKTGLIAGGAAGAVIGGAALGGGVLGAVVGAGAGALGGRAIDRSITAKRRCR